MGRATEAEAPFDSSSRRKKELLIDITTLTPCVSSSLENTAHHARKHLADAVEPTINKYRGSFPTTHSFFYLAMSTCDDASPDVHTLVKNLAIKWVDHRSVVQHLAEGTEVQQQALSDIFYF